MNNNQIYLDKLIKSVYSKWLTETYGISNSPVRLKDCELTKYYLRFKLVQKEFEPKISLR